MIYIDKKILAILKHIKRKGDRGITWGELQKKFGEETADISLLVNLSQEEYIVTQDEKGEWIDNDFFSTSYSFRSFTTSKSNQLIEQRCFDFWKWIIPTLISVVALAVSALTA